MELQNVYEDKDRSFIQVFRGGELINTISEQSTCDINLSSRHTEIEIYNIDFPLDDNELEIIGKIMIVPAAIEATSCHSLYPDFILICLSQGASYWIKSEEFHKMIVV